MASGAFAMPADALAGIATDGGTAPGSEAVAEGVVAVAPVAAARFVDDGDAAGVKPAIATACGFDCAEGNSGFADRATADVSSGALSCFHQAKRGPDWQPDQAVNTATNARIRSAVNFMFVTIR